MGVGSGSVYFLIKEGFLRSEVDFFLKGAMSLIVNKGILSRWRKSKKCELKILILIFVSGSVRS